MHTHKKTSGKRKAPMPLIALGVLSVVSSFGIGIKTAGDIETVAPTEANNMIISGDMNGDSIVDLKDVIDTLEVAQGYEEATVEQLLADPNNDGELTVDDAMRILRDIASRS